MKNKRYYFEKHIRVGIEMNTLFIIKGYTYTVKYSDEDSYSTGVEITWSGNQNADSSTTLNLPNLSSEDLSKFINVFTAFIHKLRQAETLITQLNQPKVKKKVSIKDLKAEIA